MRSRPRQDDTLRGRPSPSGRSDPARWLAEMAAPRWADFAMLYVSDRVVAGDGESAPEDGDGASVMVLHRTASVGRTRALLELFPEREVVRWRCDTPTLRRLRRGEPVHLAVAGSEAAERLAGHLDDPRLAEAARTRMVLLLPLLDSGRLVGAALLLSAVPLQGHRIEALTEMARWSGETLGAGREMRDRLALTAELERAVVPPERLRRPGLELVSRMRNGLDGHWCDVLELPAGRTALVVGDTGGPGARAAALLVQLRAQLQALALTELPPGRVLDVLDRLVQRSSTAQPPAVGCLYAVHDPVTGEFQLASAGRITSVLVRPGGHAELLDPEPGAPLGSGLGAHPARFGRPERSEDRPNLPLGAWGSSPRPTRFLAPEPGSLLLFGTRGLTLVGGDLVGFGQSPPAGLPKLTETSEFTGLDGLSGLCDRLLKGAGRGAVALLAARLPAPVPRREPGGIPAAEPVRESEFFGRKTETHEVRRLLEDARLVTLTGGPGIGKSRLARESARLLGQDFPDGIVTVDLTAVASPSGVPRAVEGALRERLGLALVGLTDRRILLVLDGCDRLLDPCAQFVRSLLRAAPRLRVLGTGRQQLGLTGEHVLPLSPLGLDAAARLFTTQAAPRPAGEDPAELRRLCARLDAVPLMVELAARAAPPGLTAAELAERFESAGDFDGFGTPEAVAAARAAVELSHELCTPEERLLWARLSVFDGRFGLDAAERVCVDELLTARELLPLLSALVGKSVVTSELGRRGRGYRLLHGVRGYGLERLAAQPGHERLIRLHDEWLTGAGGRSR